MNLTQVHIHGKGCLMSEHHKTGNKGLGSTEKAKSDKNKTKKNVEFTTRSEDCYQRDPLSLRDKRGNTYVSSSIFSLI